MNRNKIILVLRKKDIEKKIEKLSLSINTENKKDINKTINKLKNELNNINYELEEILGGNQ